MVRSNFKNRGRRTRRVLDVDDVTEEVTDAIEEGLRDYIADVHEEAVDQTVNNMFRGRDAMGRPWEPLENDDGTPLVDTGTLLGSVDTDSYTNLSVPAGVFTSSVDYAPYHEFGAPDAGIPSRPFLAPALQYADDISPDVFARTVDPKVDRALMD